jgi:hypothetical protein
MTKAQLALMAAPIDRQSRHDSFVRFLLNALALGAGIGTGIATLILLTDTFGLSTLMRGQSDALATACAFIFDGAMISAPLSLAVAVGLASRVERVYVENARHSKKSSE